jgi:hypothetical protein
VVGVALLPRTQVAQMKVLEEDVWVFAPRCRLDRQYVLLAGVQVPALVQVSVCLIRALGDL